MIQPAPVLPVRLRILVSVLLAVSFGCNVSVLFLPFMDLRLGLSTNPYTLFSSIHMLWEAKLYILVVLVIGFSVLFPFAKLATLAWVCGSRGGVVSAQKQRWLLLVEQLGKWSMLDVFLVCLILSLTSDQLLVGARPLIGIPLFVSAIVLSMSSGEILADALHSYKAGKTVRPSTWRTGAWLSLSGLALVGALSAPFLQISDWDLADSQYSIVSIVPVLWQDKSAVAAVIISLFLIIFPILGWLASVHFWLGLRKGNAITSVHKRLRFFRRWSMLDVFGLALAIFLVEGDYLMKTEVRMGAIYLLALLLFQQLFQIALERILSVEEKA